MNRKNIFGAERFHDVKVMIKGFLLACFLMVAVFIWTHRQAYVIATFHSDVVSSLKISQPVIEVKK